MWTQIHQILFVGAFLTSQQIGMKKKNFTVQVLPSDLFSGFKWPFQGLLGTSIWGIKRALERSWVKPMYVRPVNRGPTLKVSKIQQSLKSSQTSHTAGGWTTRLIETIWVKLDHLSRILGIKENSSNPPPSHGTTGSLVHVFVGLVQRYVLL